MKSPLVSLEPKRYGAEWSVADWSDRLICQDKKKMTQNVFFYIAAKNEVIWFYGSDDDSI